MKSLLSLSLTFACAVAAVAGENLVQNPSAEKVARDGKPEGWGLYAGAGGMKLTASEAERHTGRRAARLELSKWYLPKGAADRPENRDLSGAIVLANTSSYQAKGAVACKPGQIYAFSFWYKGDIPSARVAVTGWPSFDGDDKQRAEQQVSAPPLAPGPNWQRATGTFRTEAGIHCFALRVLASGKESQGFRLGSLWVDDAEIVAKAYPQGELRAVWCELSKAKERGPGIEEIERSTEQLARAGFNTLFPFVSSRYVAALDQPEFQNAESRAGWDALGELIRVAKRHKLEVHAWYSPWVYKDAGSPELRTHPDWAAVSVKGIADPRGVCFVRPEVRQFELDLIGKLVDRYPDLAGVHIEEPGFNWGADYCYCAHCRRLAREWFGLDIVKDPVAARSSLHSLAAFMCTDFFARLRQAVNGRRPQVWVSANGSGGANSDWYIGRDWTTWARRGYIDFYVPQLYTESVETFIRQAERTRSCLGDCDLVTGMAVSWSGIYPRRQDPKNITAEIDAARKLGAKGFCVFHQSHFYEEHFSAVRQAAASR